MSRQTEFHAALLDAARPAPAGLVDGHGRAAPRRFNVYRNNVAVSLTDALEAAFPATARLLGPENFRGLAGRFLRQSPPASPLMMHYGAGFDAFLAGIDALGSMGYLPDIARLEHSLRHAYHAADAEPIPPDALSAVAPETLPNLRFSFAPAVQLVISDWPIFDIYQYALNPDAPKPQPAKQAVLISRPAFDPMQTMLSHTDATFLRALIDGQTLAKAAALTPDFDLSHPLGILLSERCITSFST